MKKCLFLIILISAQVASAEPYTVKWGLALPLSGSSARAGVDIQRGFDMALEDLKSENVTHEFIVEDTQYKNREAVTAAQKLISIDDVDIVVALWDTADGVAPLADRYNKLHTSIRWNNNIAKNFKNTFTFECTYEDYAKNFAQLFKALGFKKVSILNQESNGWNLALDSFIESAKINGLTVASSQSYLPDVSDFKAFSLRALKDKPDIVLVNDVGENLEQVAKQVKTINPEQRITGYLDYPMDRSLFEKEYYVTQLSLDEDFSRRYEKRYGEPIYARAQLAYDMFVIVSKVLKKFDSKPSTEELVKALSAVGSFEGMSGPITSTDKGKVFRTQAKIMQIVDGKRVNASEIKF